MAPRFGRAAACIAASSSALASYALCSEEAPGTSDSRRRLLPLPAVAARRLGLSSTPPSGEELAQVAPQPFRHHFASEWGSARLPTPPAGQVHAGEGWLLEVVPSHLFYCGTRHRSVILTTGAILACFPEQPDTCDSPSTQQPTAPSSSDASELLCETQGGQAALLFLMGHEMGHGLAQHTPEKALVYSARMLWFCWRYMAAEWRYTLRCLLAGAPHWPAPPQCFAAMESNASALKLQVATSLQRLSWHHEWEADGVAVLLMAAAGVPQDQWADGLAMLQRVATGEQGGPGMEESCVGCVGSVEAAGPAPEAAEAASYLAAAARLAGQTQDLLAAGNGEAAQQLLDGNLRWPLPMQWLKGMAPAERVQLLACLMHTHPPLASRLVRVSALADRGKKRIREL